MFALSSSSELLYFTCRGGSLLPRHISVQALHRNFNQVERGSRLGATRSLNSCHSVWFMGMNIFVGGPSFKETVSINSEQS